MQGFEFRLENNLYNHIKMQLRVLFPTVYNETDFDLLAHVYLYGDKSRQLLVDSGYLKSKASVRNYICKWRKAKVIRKEALALNPLIQLYTSDATYTINYCVIEKV